MAIATAAPPSGKRLQYWSNEFWLLLADARRQTQEVLTLANNIANKTKVADKIRDNAEEALKAGDIHEAHKALHGLGVILNDIQRDARKLEELEQRDVMFETSFRNLLSIVERTLKRCFGSK